MNSVQLGRRGLDVPILQGGMGVGVSMSRLAGAVAACGGMGTISTAVAGFDEPDFDKDPAGANLRALARHVRRAKEIARGRGLVAVNAMVATAQYADSVRTAIQAGVDAVVSGARAAKLLCRAWSRHHGRLPDFVLVEGPRAGGHLGFSRQELAQPPALETLVAETVEVLKDFGSIPVFAAGGLWTGADAARMEQAGAAGVQFATRFIATEECDASQGYKDVLLAAKPQDVVLVQSPVGMPGRALRTPLVEKVESGLRFAPKKCVNCLTPCSKASTVYCIARALVQAVRGNYEEGLFFCGGEVHRLDRMRTVPQLMEEWTREWRAFA